MTDCLFVSKKEIAEVEERKNDNVVEMTLKSIAKAHGYRISDAMLITGIPTVGNIEKTVGNVGRLEPEVKFGRCSSDTGMRFFVVPSSVSVMSENADAYLKALTNAISMCEALNQIDCSAWPSAN